MGESRLVESPNEWLADAVRRHQLSQRSLARSLGTDVSRFNRWVHGDEQIPRAYLAELAQHFPPTDIAHVLKLKDCEDFSDQLHRRAAALSNTAGLGPYPVHALLRQIENLVSREHPSDSSSRVDAVLSHLVDATGAVLTVQRAVDVSFREPLLLPPSVMRFRYPMNHFIGTFIDLDEFVPAKAREAKRVEEFRERLLDDLRAMASAKPHRNRWKELARQFSVHVLARHGSAADREHVTELLQMQGTSVDPLLQRISFTGVILGGADADTMNRFLRALQKDRSLDRVNLFFNAFHYGDATFAADGSLPRLTKSFRHTVPHVLRHLEQPERYASIQSVEAWTLLQILATAGPKPFLQRAILHRLDALIRSSAFLAREPNQSIRQQFQRDFARLLKDAR
jgi:hypothetical protein